MKIAMLFPGFGSQYVGMGKEFYDEHRIVQEYFEQASNCLDINFVKLCFASSENELNEMRHAYTAVFVLSAAIVSLLKQTGIEPDIVAGFNQGEYAALFAAGGWGLPDGLYLLNKFAGFYQEALDGMDVSAIEIKGVSTHALENACLKAKSHGDERVYIALYETANQHVVTGDTVAVERVRDIVTKNTDDEKISIGYVDLAIGLHSEQMNTVIERYRMYLEKVDFHDLSVCMLESLNGECIERGAKTKERVIQRINSPVIWTKVMEGLAPYDAIIQIGPGSELATWAKQQYPDKKVIAINKPGDITTLEQMINREEK